MGEAKLGLEGKPRRTWFTIYENVTTMVPSYETVGSDLPFRKKVPQIKTNLLIAQIPNTQPFQTREQVDKAFSRLDINQKDSNEKDPSQSNRASGSKV